MRRPGLLSLPSAMMDARADYEAAQRSSYQRNVRYPSQGAPGDWHIRNESDYLRILELSRYLDLNEITVSSMVDLAKDNIVGDGFTLEPETGDADLDAQLVERWRDWSTDPMRVDDAQERDLRDLEHLAARAAIVDGDIYFVGLRSGALQIVEAHRVRTPTYSKRKGAIVHGVELDEARRHLRVYVTRDEIDPMAPVKLSEMNAIDVRSDGVRIVFHVHFAKRATMTRAVSMLAPMIPTARMLGDVEFAKLVQQQVVSCITYLIEKQHDPKGFDTSRGGAGMQTGPQREQGYGSANQSGDLDVQVIEGLRPGTSIRGLPGEKVQGFSPNVPNAEYFPHVRLILQRLGMNLGLPLVVALMDASETNFSGYRGAIETAKRGWRRRQKQLENRFHRPVYRWFLEQLSATDPAMARARRIIGDERFFRHVWHRPGWPYVSPDAEAKADATRLEKLIISPRRLMAERGAEWSHIAAEIVQDRGLLFELAIARAAQLNEAHPEARVDWRELIHLQAPATARPRDPNRPTGQETASDD